MLKLIPKEYISLKLIPKESSKSIKNKNLSKNLSDMEEFKIDSIWRDYKGNLYQIKGFCVYEEDSEPCILYTNYCPLDSKILCKKIKNLIKPIEYNNKLQSKFSLIQ